MDLLRQRAKELAKDRITGVRLFDAKTPLYLHSWKVGDLLAEHGFSEEIQIAGILHDILEDSRTTTDELRELGYAENILTLVQLVSHDNAIINTIEQWEDLMYKLIRAKNITARAIKIADITDNITEPIIRRNDSHFWPQHLSRTTGVPLWYGYMYLRDTSLYQEFLRRYFVAMHRVHDYSFWSVTGL